MPACRAWCLMVDHMINHMLPVFRLIFRWFQPWKLPDFGLKLLGGDQHISTWCYMVLPWWLDPRLYHQKNRVSRIKMVILPSKVGIQISKIDKTSWFNQWLWRCSGICNATVRYFVNLGQMPRENGDKPEDGDSGILHFWSDPKRWM